MNAPLALTATWILSAACLADTAAPPSLRAAKRHVNSIPIHSTTELPHKTHTREINALLSGRDPESTTASYLHGIRRHAGKLLKPEQARRWNELLEERQPLLQRLHDERNVLRGYFFAKAWELPLTEAEERPRLEHELRAWLKVWLDITYKERIAKHRLCRDAWRLLSADQLNALQRGDWDAYVRKSTGHARAYFGDRVVARALGKPDRQAAFEDLSNQFADEHKGVQANLLDAERRWRILTFAQPAVSDDLLAFEWNHTSEALASFFLNQAEHIDRLTRAGYDHGSATIRERIAAQPGKTLQETASKVKSKLTAGAALLAKLQAAKFPAARIPCEGDFRHHLQGVAIDAAGDIYWSFTTTLIKTDPRGRKLRAIEVPNHHGDLCVAGERVYVAVNFGPFNQPEGTADSWVYIYNLELKLLAKRRTPEVVYGAGGMDFHDGRFFVIGGLPASHESNYVYEYDRQFHFQKRHEIKSGQTLLGIQTAAFIDGKWWFGCYGNPRELLITDKDFNLLGKHVFDCAYGIAATMEGQILVAEGPCANGRCSGTLVPATPNPESGLRKLD